MAVQLVAGAVSQLINSSANISLPVQLPAELAIANKNALSINVWINANWGSTATPRGVRSFVGIYGPLQRTQGLSATYYDNKFLTEPAIATQLESNINQNVPPGVSPLLGTIGTSGIYSVRWTGYFKPPVSGVYYFRTQSDDGVRIYINGVLVIENWTDHAATINTSATPGISLTAGAEVTIIAEYYNQGGDGVCVLTYGIGNNTTVASSFQAIPVGNLATSAPPPDNPYTAIQIGTKTGSGEISVWTYGGTNLVSTPKNFNNAANNTLINVCYTWDGNVHNFFVNGLLVATDTSSQVPGILKYVTINGYLAGASNETDNHIVDTYRLYNRVLQADEILTIYNSSGSRHGIVNGLIASYEFNELAEGVDVSSVVDVTGNGAPLLMTGNGKSPKYTYATSFANTNIRPPLST